MKIANKLPKTIDSTSKSLYSLNLGEEADKNVTTSKIRVRNGSRSSQSDSKLKKLLKPSPLKIGLLIFLILFMLGGGFYLSKLAQLRKTGLSIGLFDPITLGVKTLTGGDSNSLSKLEQQDGRTNVLLIGVDARGKGGSLNTDSLMVLSYDHKTNKVAQISFPRDMRATYKIYGSTRTGKVNGVFPLTFSETNSYDEAFQALGKSLEEISGLKIHYGMMINFYGFKEIIDELGGVTVNVENTFTDYTYPCDADDKATCFYTVDHGPALAGQVCKPADKETCVKTVKFSAGEQKMDGQTALIYSRSRHSMDAGEGSDFARARRQSKVIVALKEKAVANNLYKQADFANELIGILGDNIRFFNLSSTDIQNVIESRELITKLTDFAVVIDTQFGAYPDLLFRGEDLNDGAGYTVYPLAKNFDKVKETLKVYLENPFIIEESASVAVVRTNNKKLRGDDYFAIKRELWAKKLGFSVNYNDNVITISTPKVSGTPTPTVSTEETYAIFYRFNLEKSASYDYYKKVVTDLGNGKKVVEKKAEELPKELERFRKDNDFIVVIE